MDDAGFTLADVLAGVFIVSLTLVGLGQAVQVGARLQARTARDVAQASEMSRWSALLTAALPTDRALRRGEEGLSGSRTRCTAPCAASRCEAVVRPGEPTATLSVNGRTAPLPPGIRPEFRYLDQWGGEHGAWPPGEAKARLTAVALVDASRTAVAPLAVRRLWREQPAACAFDPVTASCMEPADGR